VKNDFGDLLAAAVTPEQIDKYIERRLASKRGTRGELIPGDRPASINRSLQLLGQCFSLAVKRGKLSRSPYIRKLSEADNVRQGFFSEAEIKVVLANLPDDGLRDFVEWGSCAGQRKSEIASLTWDMVDGDEIRVPGELCKNRSARVIPLGPELAEIIARRKKARRMVAIDGMTRLAEPIFHRGDGKRVGEFRKSWHSACVAAGLGKIACPNCRSEANAESSCRKCKIKRKYSGRLFHDFRRSCARRLLAAGVPTQIAKKITGHQTDSMFDRYAIVSSADVLAAQKKVAQFRRQA